MWALREKSSNCGQQMEISQWCEHNTCIIWFVLCRLIGIKDILIRKI